MDYGLILARTCIYYGLVQARTRGVTVKVLENTVSKAMLVTLLH